MENWQKYRIRFEVSEKTKWRKSTVEEGELGGRRWSEKIYDHAQLISQLFCHNCETLECKWQKKKIVSYFISDR